MDGIDDFDSFLESQFVENPTKSVPPQPAVVESNKINTVVPQIMHVGEKAGMQGVDRNRINDIIEQASKGSLFFKRQAERQEEIHKNIERMLNKVLSATPSQLANAKGTCDALVGELDKQRTYNRIIAHIDLDMFFAAVEILDNPELEEKPVAVGSNSMIATSNYVARRFGVRAAMPGFIAKKLCPELILISPNGSKYRAASNKVFEVLETYDPDLASMSLDEAYLDLTDYVKATLQSENIEEQEYYDGTLPLVWWERADQVVQEIRQKVFDKTKLNCSAGIACNTLLSKICTDINKPKGQFLLKGYKQDITDFMQNTSVEKVSGIGKVSAQFLHALDIKTCGELYEKRHLLPVVFYPINVKFYLRVALGDGSTTIKSDEQRKSKSVERTFSTPTRDQVTLVDRLDGICEELCTKYLKPYRIRGRTVTLKLKRTTFSTFVRSYTMLFATNDKSVIFTATKNLLLTEIANSPPDVGFRLMGVRLSNLADDSSKQTQMTIDTLLRNQELASGSKNEEQIEEISQDKNLELHQADDSPMEVSAEECIDIVDECDERATDNTNDTSVDNKEFDSDNVDITGTSQNSSEPSRSQELNKLSQDEQKAAGEAFPCPYCFKSFAEFFDLERHVDICTKKCNTSLLEMQFTQSPSTNKAPVKLEVKNSPTQQKLSIDMFSSQSPSTKSTKKKSIKKSPSNKKPSSSDNTQFSQKISKLEQTTLQLTARSDSPILLHYPTKAKAADPFQCPFCFHGFLQFSLLEQHVSLCKKNPERF